MRRNARSWGIKVALGLISLAFIFFLGGGGRISGRTQNSVATVGKEDISYQEFQRTQIRNESYFRNTYGDQLTPELLRALDIPSSTLSQLVNSALLRQEAARIGLIVPDESVREVIRSMDAFQRNGHFSPGIYRAAVERQGMTPSAFEYSIRNDILSSQMRDLVTRAVHVTDGEAFQEFADDQEKVSLEYAKVESKDLQDEVKIDDEDLQSYFDHNAESFRRPETVKVRYITYAPSKIAPNPEVSDERIEEYYQLNLETEFTREEEVGARHILKKVPEDADEETRAAARAAIEKIQQRIKDGADFAKLAREESDDSSAANGGDLGMFKRGVMVAPFEDAAFSLPVGGVSEIIETRFGYHIIKVYAHQAAGEEPLAEVRDTIVKKLSADVAREKAYDAAIDDSARLQDHDADFETVAKDRGIEIKETPLLDPESPVPGLGKAPSFSEAAMGLGEPGSISEPVHEGDTYYLLQLVERKDSYIPELADVRDAVEAAYRKQKAVDLARDEAESILAAVKGGKTLEQAAKAASTKVESTDSFSHRGSFVPGLGDVPGLKDLAFRAEKSGEVLPRTFVHRDDAYVFVLKKREPADRAKFEEDKQPYIDRVRQRQEQQIYAEFLRELKERTQISYNEQLLSGILKQ